MRRHPIAELNTRSTAHARLVDSFHLALSKFENHGHNAPRQDLQSERNHLRHVCGLRRLNIPQERYTSQQQFPLPLMTRHVQHSACSTRSRMNGHGAAPPPCTNFRPCREDSRHPTCTLQSSLPPGLLRRTGLYTASVWPIRSLLTCKFITLYVQRMQRYSDDMRRIPQL